MPIKAQLKKSRKPWILGLTKRCNHKKSKTTLKQLSEKRNKKRRIQAAEAYNWVSIPQEKPKETALIKQTIKIKTGCLTVTKKQDQKRGRIIQENKPTIDTGSETALRIIEEKDGS